MKKYISFDKSDKSKIYHAFHPFLIGDKSDLIHLLVLGSRKEHSKQLILSKTSEYMLGYYVNKQYKILSSKVFAPAWCKINIIHENDNCRVKIHTFTDPIMTLMLFFMIITTIIAGMLFDPIYIGLSVLLGILTLFLLCMSYNDQKKIIDLVLIAIKKELI